MEMAKDFKIKYIDKREKYLVFKCSIKNDKSVYKEDTELPIQHLVHSGKSTFV